MLLKHEIVLTLNFVHIIDNLECIFVYKGESLSSLSESYILTSIRFFGFKLTLLLAVI